MKRFEADLEAKKINYNNNPILKWNLSNSAISVDRNDNIALVKTSNQDVGLMVWHLCLMLL